MHELRLNSRASLELYNAKQENLVVRNKPLRKSLGDCKF